ncbi:MAG: cache domain-containing protein, partial [Solobacterium sp.]|nr:cache domain-containing protein [Solobacterium sp.]
MTLISAIQIDRAFEDTITEMLQVQAETLADTYDTTYEGEWTTDEEGNVYKGGELISGNYTLIDELKGDTGLDYTIIWGDTRIATTLLKEGTNERNIGSQISAEVWAKVQKGEIVNVRNLTIGGQKY